MPETGLSPLERDLVEEFGSIYETYGFKRVNGLIAGLLMTRSEPLPLDDMAELLRRSKGPLSVAVRDLAAKGVIRKVEGPENRRDYYTTHPDLFHNNFKFNMTTVRKNRRTAEQFLREMRATDAERHTVATGHLEHMLAFYSLMESFYEEFSTRWEEVRTSLDAPDA